jgi:hypothetical protein
VPVTVVPTRWVQFGRAAGHIRNRTMAQLPGVAGVLVVWDGTSSGTASMLALGHELGLTVHCIQP